MECVLSVSVFSHLRRLWMGEDSPKDDGIDGRFLFCFTFYINLFNAFAPARSSPNMASYWLLKSKSCSSYKIVLIFPSFY